MAWGGFALAFVAFFVTHSVPVRAPVKPWLVARLGARGFTILYSVLSLAVLAWLVTAAGRAPFVPLWPWAAWHAYVPLLVMAPVCLIVTSTLGRPNPFSFGGSGNDPFDPRQPGWVRLTRHPLLLALALWAAAHVVANPDLAHVILFGTFAAFALLGGRIIDRRKKREMGEAWARLLRLSSDVPFGKALRQVIGLRQVVAALALWAVLIVLHPLVLGISPLP